MTDKAEEKKNLMKKIFGEELPTEKETEVEEPKEEIEISTEVEVDNIAGDLFNNPELLDKMTDDMFVAKSEDIEEIATKTNEIIWKCNEVIMEWVKAVFENKNTIENYKKHKLLFCNYRFEAVKLRFDYEEYKDDEEFLKRFVLESSDLFDYYVHTAIEAVKASLKKVD